MLDALKTELALTQGMQEMLKGVFVIVFGLLCLLMAALPASRYQRGKAPKQWLRACFAGWGLMCLTGGAYGFYSLLHHA